MGKGLFWKTMSPRLKKVRPVRFSNDFHGNNPENPLLFKLNSFNLPKEDKSGTSPEKEFPPKSNSCKLVQFFKSSEMPPCKKFKPRESFSSAWSWHIESNGRIPDSFCWGRLISLTSPLELHTIPVKLHMEVPCVHELKTLVFGFCRADLNASSGWSSSELEKDIRLIKKNRKTKSCRKNWLADMPAEE